MVQERKVTKRLPTNWSKPFTARLQHDYSSQVHTTGFWTPSFTGYFRSYNSTSSQSDPEMFKPLEQSFHEDDLLMGDSNNEKALAIYH